MSTGIGPHKATEPGHIVAWHSKCQFRAGKQLDEAQRSLLYYHTA